MVHNKMKGATWDSIFLIVVRLATILTTIIQTKILSIGLSLHEYGSYSQALLVVSVTTSCIMLGLGDGLNYFYNSNLNTLGGDGKRTAYVNTIFFLETVLGIGGALVICFGRNLLANYFGNPDVSILLCIVAVKPVLDNIIYLYQLLFISNQKAKIIAIRNLVISVAKVLAIWVFVQIFSSVRLICVSLVALDVANWIVFKLLLSRDQIKVNIARADLHCIKKIVAYSLPMGVYAFTNALLRDVDKIIIGNMASTADLAIYTNCSKILPFDIVAASFATVLIPYIMRYVSANEKKGLESLFANYMKIGYYTVWTLAAGALIVSGQLVEFLYSPEYLAGKGIFILYLFDSMIRFASFHLVLTASGHSRVIMRYSIISLAANLVLNIVLFYLFGMIGPAISTVLVTAVYTGAILKKTLVVTGMQITHIFNFRELMVFVGELVIAAIVFSYFNRMLLLAGLDRSLTMMIVAALFCGSVLLINARKICAALKTINSLRL